MFQLLMDHQEEMATFLLTVGCAAVCLFAIGAIIAALFSD